MGADKVWANIISKYNVIPFVKKVNPDLTDYVTNQAMTGVFKMIAVEEKNIRTNLNSRTSTLLQKVFADARQKISQNLPNTEYTRLSKANLLQNKNYAKDYHTHTL